MRPEIGLLQTVLEVLQGRLRLGELDDDVEELVDAAEGVGLVQEVHEAPPVGGDVGLGVGLGGRVGFHAGVGGGGGVGVCVD